MHGSFRAGVLIEVGLLPIVAGLISASLLEVFTALS